VKFFSEAILGSWSGSYNFQIKSPNLSSLSAERGGEILMILMVFSREKTG